MKRLNVLLMIAVITAVCASTAMASSWKFAVLDDSRAKDWDNNGFGVAANTLGILVNDIKSQSVDLVIFPGDMATGETNNTTSLSQQLDSWKSIMKPLSDAGVAIYTIRGNHEYNPLKNGMKNAMDPSNSTYRSHFPLAKNATSPDGGFTYSFTHKNVRFIGFDQYIDRTTSFNNTLYAPHSNKGQMMESWVLAQINNSTSPLNFAFGHEMLFSSKSHPDCMANDPDSRDALVAVLGTHNGTYLCGHDHMYLRGIASDGKGQTVPELIVGTAGGGNYDYAPFNTTGYTGPDTFNVSKVLGNSSKPYFGYVLITVNDNNTWTSEFKGFQYDTYAKGKPHNAEPIQTMDSFSFR